MQIHFNMKPFRFFWFITAIFAATLVNGALSPVLSWPSAIISLPDREHAILVEKQTQTLYIYTAEPEQKTLTLAFKSACSTGEAAGPKEKAGDKKTPEGIYFLIDEYEDKYLTPVYGKKAFPTDYPNLVDKRLGKNGSAIWIHGTDKALKPMDSNGCIAMENEDVVKLSDYIRLNATPLIITEKIGQSDKESLTGKENQVRALIADWVKAMSSGSYHEYLSFYDASYVPDISWWEEWLVLRDTLKSQASALEFRTKDTGIYQHGKLLLVLTEFIVSDKKTTFSLGKRKLFLKESPSGLRIIGDEYQVKSKTFEKAPHLLLAGAGQFLKRKKPPEPVQAPPAKPKENDPGSPVKAVRQWLAAWSAKDMDAYSAFYAPGFYADGMNKSQWVKRKKRLAKQYSYIKVTGSKFKTIKKKDGVEVRFMQDYTSNVFSTKGTKHLKLVNKGGLWKIYRENWKEK